IGCRRDRSGGQRWQADNKDCAALLFVVTGNLTVMILDDAISGAEPETSPLADWLGRVEGIENALGLAQSGTGVRKIDDDRTVFAGQRNDQPSPSVLFESIDRVVNDLQASCEKLIRVAQYSGQPRFADKFDLYL